MKMIEQRFKVQYEYPVYFTDHLFDKDNELLADFLGKDMQMSIQRKLLVILDEGVVKHYPHLTENIKTYIKTIKAYSLTAIIIVPGGETVKNEDTYCKKVVAAINREKIDRHSFVIAIGGGAVLDMVGFASTIAHRGVRFIRIPTTVLSQNDSGVGVKNGINYFGKKNFIGSFSPPAAVFNDTHFLITLDNRNWRSGIAEAVKVALIKDKAFFKWIETHIIDLVGRDLEVMAKLVQRCASLHLQHISSGDPFENGSSRPLDFGHWSAHKLEQLSGFSLLHGESVAIGIAIDTIYSQYIGWLNATEVKRILSLLYQLQFELYHESLENPELMAGIQEFREHLGGELTIMMLKGIGKGENINTIDRAAMKCSIQSLRTYREQRPTNLKTLLS